jgi:hypothetical protein
MRKLSRLLVFLMLTVASVASAHHSMSAEFDVNRTATWKGEIVSLDWANPHVYFNFEVKDAAGKVALWRLQGNPPHKLQAAGVTRDLVKPGTSLTVTGFPSVKAANPNFSLTGFAREIELPDGRKLEFGSLVWGPPR